MTASKKKLAPGEILFKEGDAPDSMYVVKAGHLSVFKLKGKSEIELADVGPGQMFGEMAFFDSKPRSASVKATTDAEVIVLPFQALHGQFKTFPEWLKTMVKTVNDHLRDANIRIRNLEQSTTDTRVFPPHVITKLCAILALVGHRFGEASPEGIIIPGGTLRRYTIQVFQEATNKMQKLIETLVSLGHMKAEDLGEGKQRLTLLKPQMVQDFVDFYNEYLFEEPGKRVTIEEPELKILRGLIFFAKQLEVNPDGMVRVSLSHIQNESMKSLGHVITVNEFNPLVKKNLIGEKESQNNELFSTFKMAEVEKILPFWELIYALDKIQR